MARGRGKARGNGNARGNANVRASYKTIELPELNGGEFSLAAAEASSNIMTAESFREDEFAASDELLQLDMIKEQLKVGDQPDGVNTVGRYTVRGLDGVLSASRDPRTGEVRVTFRDGSEAVVNADGTLATCNCEAMPCSHRVAALLQAAAYGNLDIPSDLQAQMAETLSAYSEDRRDLDKLLAASTVGQEVMEALGEVEMASVEGAIPNHGLAKRITRLREAMRGQASPLVAAMAGSEGEEDGKISAEIKEARQKTSEELGLPIYEPDPNYLWDDNLAAIGRVVMNAIDRGGRNFGFLGPQGTGKNSFAYELSAAFGMPVYEIDFSSGDDLEMLLGTTGLREGEKGGTNTELEIGPLTKAATAKGGSIVVLNEIVEAPRGQLTALHNMIGSGLGNENRFISLKSTAKFTDENGNEVVPRFQVDKDTMFILTWNPDRADRRPHPALASRLVQVGFDHGTEEDEIERVMTRVYGCIKEVEVTDKNGSPSQLGKVMGWNYDAEKSRKGDDGEEEYVPISEQIEDLKKEIAKDVKFFRLLREKYNNGALEHCPDTRTMVAYSACRILELNNVVADDQISEATETALRQIEFMWNQSQPRDERWAAIRESASEIYTEINFA